ncbi:MAG: alpha-2-macroglobulin, partial [Planctomycetota bacterium]
MTISSRLVLTLCLLTVALVTFGAGQTLDPSDRVAVLKAYNEGQYKEAHDALRVRALELEENRFRVDDLRLTADCLRRLNRIAELDSFLEAAVDAHGDDWRTLWATAELYRSARKYGHIVAGEFQRGRHRGRAQRVHTAQRDRARALQLYLQAESAALSVEVPNADLALFYLGWAGALKSSEAWRLQILSDLGELPDYTEGWYYERQQSAPVDADGNPIYYRAPESWETAANDGERWRWTLARAAFLDPNRTDSVRFTLGDFFLSQFGVQSMAHYGISQDPEDESGPFAVHTLEDHETVAKLANGVRRFDLPDEFNPLKIFRSIRDQGTDSNTQGMAADRVASIYENRRQYPKAADAWRLAMEFGKNDYRAQRLDSIVGNWGGFLGTAKNIAGQPIEFEYRFRNATEVEFTVYEVKIDKLLADVKAYLEKGPERVHWQKINLSNLGYRLVQQN